MIEGISVWFIARPGRLPVCVRCRGTGIEPSTVTNHPPPCSACGCGYVPVLK